MTRVAKHGDVKFVVGGSASSSSSAITTAAIDTNGFGVLTLGLAKSAGTIAVTATSSDTSDGSFTSDTNIIGATSMASADTNGAVSYIGDKRYVKFVITPASGTFSYGVILSEKRIAD